MSWSVSLSQEEKDNVTEFFAEQKLVFLPDDRLMIIFDSFYMICTVRRVGIDGDKELSCSLFYDNKLHNTHSIRLSDHPTMHDAFQRVLRFAKQHLDSAVKDLAYKIKDNERSLNLVRNSKAEVDTILDEVNILYARYRNG